MGQLIQQAGSEAVISIDSACDSLQINPLDYQHSINHINQINKLHHNLIASLTHHLGTSQKHLLIQSNLKQTRVDRPTTYDAIDCQLCDSREGGLLSSPPPSLIVQFNQPPNSPSKPLALDPSLSLDRYLESNQALIQSSRAQLESLSSQIQTIELQLDSLQQTSHQHNPDHLINQAISHSSDDSIKLTELSRVRDWRQSQVESLERDLCQAQAAKEKAFDEIEVGEADYQLSGFILRNGLNGRSSCVSVVLGEDGEYYKVDDQVPTKVDLVQALNDKTGQILGAGIAFAFYQPNPKPTRLELRGGADNDSVSDSGSEDEVYEDEVELGTLVKLEPGTKFDVDLGVGKVGGKPVWLDPSNPLDYKTLSCPTCDQTMSFLVQLNSPDDERHFAAARTLYLFGCRTPTCQFTTKLFRFQSSSPNQFFPHSDEAIAARTKFGEQPGSIRRQSLA